MTGKQYLEHVRWVNDEINSLIKSRDEILRLASGVSGISYDKDRVQTSPANVFEEHMIRAEEKREQLNDLIDKYVDMRADADVMISSIANPDFRKILRERYFDGLRLAEVAEKHFWTVRYTKKRFQSAIYEFEVIFSKFSEKSKSGHCMDTPKRDIM